MSRARGALCRACLALAAALAALLLLPLPLPRAPGPARTPAPAPRAPPSRPAAPSLRPDDVFIAVKTTRKNHGPRLRLLLHTWISRARRQTFIFTDGDDPELELQGGECPPAPAPAGPGPRDPGAAATALLWVPLSVEAPEARVGHDAAQVTRPAEGTPCQPSSAAHQPLTLAASQGVGLVPRPLKKPQQGIRPSRPGGGRVINTNCSAVRTRQALCCKMSVEYDKFIESGRKWFCHVDDDNYVNPSSLLHLLSSFSPSQDVYLGRPSLDHPIEATERVQGGRTVTTVKFWFATGGAGFCLSRGLALKMSPWASLGSFMSTAEQVRLPDDCTVGYIVEGLLGARLLHSPLFHSHLENLQRLPPDTLLQQVTLSYGGPENPHNVVNVAGGFSVQQDPTRFKSVHCLLYPDTDWCPRQKQGAPISR
ncbi:beta-1,3-N-acetylglucosaminyltransferase radical fringe isoform X2 [Theropithecus gelada]|uniref:beta-1,3-N-acetylglucosaminyltransferase radical fringe isoform X2 n=1 Tax=Theropithecus gelada TaxID=9565 RepID=UPI000DC174AF|nr:beta-1,3-N-acetylglucosaminyltransferase radical fringe isoform X2 [Theropithecus gelada]